MDDDLTNQQLADKNSTSFRNTLNLMTDQMKNGKLNMDDDLNNQNEARGSAQASIGQSRSNYNLKSVRIQSDQRQTEPNRNIK